MHAHVSVLQVGSALLDLGVKPKDRVGVIGANCPEWMLTMQGCNRTRWGHMTGRKRAQTAHALSLGGPSRMMHQHLVLHPSVGTLTQNPPEASLASHYSVLQHIVFLWERAEPSRVVPAAAL